MNTVEYYIFISVLTVRSLAHNYNKIYTELNFLALPQGFLHTLVHLLGQLTVWVQASLQLQFSRCIIACKNSFTDFFYSVEHLQAQGLQYYGG